MKVKVYSNGGTREVTVPRYNTLTPKSAIVAAHPAFGPGADCKVTDGQRIIRVGGMNSKRQVRR